ncbi:hypothetical protein FKR81_12665 [Lentzea tibetensis]|uniref:Uncharacterized protein n=1 Tax=Lentzea tibetensis TaxID=2591470 RepID=A0A563EX62_9PSEU|nr:hypothetical protein [Lentzea tibetensis]TWP51714.1 hypothetical protein FKR81_12665 [Lentzea tibetensis]
MSQLVFGEPDFFSSSQIRDYCNNARMLMRPVANELRVGAEELEAALKYVKSANPMPFGLDSRVRAKLVAKHMIRGAEAVEVLCGSMVKTYLSFRKHYVAELSMASNRREFKFDV